MTKSFFDALIAKLGMVSMLGSEKQYELIHFLKKEAWNQIYFLFNSGLALQMAWARERIP